MAFNNRVVLIGTAARNGRYISPKAKYRPETDSVQVVRTKDEKYFAKRVKENLTSLPGKRITPFTGFLSKVARQVVLLCAQALTVRFAEALGDT